MALFSVASVFLKPIITNLLQKFKTCFKFYMFGKAKRCFQKHLKGYLFTIRFFSLKLAKCRSHHQLRTPQNTFIKKRKKIYSADYKLLRRNPRNWHTFSNEASRSTVKASAWTAPQSNKTWNLQTWKHSKLKIQTNKLKLI